MPEKYTEKQKTALQTLSTLKLKFGEVPFLVTPDLLLQAANCHITACRGCVEVIEYGADGTPSSVIIRWLENCGDTAKGKGTSFDLNAGTGRVMERAQDNCLEVVVFFTMCEGEDSPKIIKLLTRRRKKACCSDDAPCHGKEEQEGFRRRFF